MTSSAATERFRAALDEYARDHGAPEFDFEAPERYRGVYRDRRRAGAGYSSNP
ncbi:hypothetical protein [Nocardia alni]|uniref:hypothetical protein n=1 Tax=Nocardia alni TaxID=2815723 RepID=UPI001C24351D|nr:hypothetical protein [Nocardia alni]